ncbi:MAG TPA: hypothetical protein VHW60_21135 [Caulobacteraceae bacterium]|jgi:hypothetical protein|nr:hypothetical protein [Caulobacteraceae bacterium]
MPEGVDFGSVRRSPRDLRFIRRVVIISVIVIGGLAAADLAVLWTHARTLAKADAASWVVTGPPCPAIDAAWWGKLAITTPQTVSFQGIASERAHGDTDCYTEDHDQGKAVTPYPVCAFSAPFAVHVRTAGGDAYFEPGVGKPATISLINGQARCVVGAAPAAFN